MTSKDFILMKKKVLDEVSFLSYGHGEFFIEFIENAHRKGFKIKEIPVFFKDRIHGEAKGGGSLKGKINLVMRTFKYILKLRKLF